MSEGHHATVCCSGKPPRDLAKRAFDILASLVGIVLLGPVAFAVGFLIFLAMGRPVLFRQARSGLGGRRFTILKFRTMSTRTHQDGQPLSDQERLTSFGKLLRSTSLDELPQLINVLLGDMSLVGPRPLLPEYDGLYSPRQARRLEAVPGITGWAQINGRNRSTWEDRLEQDVWYVEHRSFWLDLWIVACTMRRVVFRDDVAAPGEATMSRFVGSQGSVSAIAKAGVAVIGAGGHAKVTIATLRAAGWTIQGVYDDNPGLLGTSISGCPVLGPASLLREHPSQPAIIAIGSSEVRVKIAQELKLCWVSVVHPSAVVDPSVTIGGGTVVFAGAIIQPGATLGEHVLVNTGASIDHDCVVGAYASIGPQAVVAGSVTIGQGATLGANCAVIPGRTVGEWSVIGAGGVAVRDVPDHVVAVGCPTRVLRTRTGSSLPAPRTKAA